MNSPTSKTSILGQEQSIRLSEQTTLLARLGRKLLLTQLQQLKQGELILIDDQGTLRFGKPSTACPICVTIHVDHLQMYADVAFGGSVGAGEAYIRGLWRSDNLVALVRLFIINRDVLNGMDGFWSFFSQPFLKLFHFWNRNSKAGSAKNIAAHYDIGNELYELMLDDTMAYSCGIFATPQTSLRDASIAKFDAACRKLDL
ncbi:MAG: class I SAM-dependent methyltransferase, partial [Steroidobacteraceae bacterium]